LMKQSADRFGFGVTIPLYSISRSLIILIIQNMRNCRGDINGLHSIISVILRKIIPPWFASCLIDSAPSLCPIVKSQL
jgi:hypothetical protein